MSEIVLNGFTGGINLDARPSMMPNGDYLTAVNAQKESFDNNNFGLVNEPSNELCFKLPDDYDYCGSAFIEERDSFLIFSYNAKTKVSQIGIGNIKSCEYKIILEDKDPIKFINKFCFSPEEKIIPEFKHLRPCNHLWAYWSNNLVYYRINIDDATCDLTYEDMVLFDCKCPSTVTAAIINEGSDLLDVGAYQFVCQLVDDDENKTNWFQISDPIPLTSPDNKLGDKSDKAFIITIDRLPKSFPKVAIAVIKTVGHIQTAEVIAVKYHNGRKISYTYRGKDKDDEPIEISEILARKTGYIRGRDLVQRNGRLFLYNLKEEWNLDAQSYASKIKTSFLVWGMPAEKAADSPTLPRGEVISLAAVYNYCDGTSSVGFHIPGRRGSKDDFTIIPSTDPKNCTNCDRFKWEIEDTAFIEENYCPSSIYEKSSNSQAKSQPILKDPEILYLPVTEADKKFFCKPPTFQAEEADFPYGNGDDDVNCPAPPVGGVDNCDDCLEPESTLEIVTGKVYCPEEEECVDGRCPSTGQPCSFCESCAKDEFKKVIISGGVEYPDSNTAAIDFDDCPNGEPVYDDEGCRIIGYKPSKLAKGKFGYWQSTELYPKTKGCNGEYLYGELAGTPVRHHMVPDESLIPFSYSKNMGVVSEDMPDNIEWGNTNVFTIGIEVCNIELPPNPPKPYCQNNPVSIYWQVVDPSDRRVNARGILTHTFLGKIGNKEYAIPKNGVNSLEQFDRHLDTLESGIKHFRGGYNNNLPIYNFHSPDTTFQKVPLTADRLFVPFQLFGKGERYGIFGEGEEPINMWHTTTNNKGARQAINLNQYIETGERVVTKPGKCEKLVSFDYHIDFCGTKKFIIATVTANVDPTQVKSFKGYFDGRLVQGTTNKIAWNINKVAGRPLQIVQFTGFELTLEYGNNICKYKPFDFNLAAVDDPDPGVDCTEDATIESVKSEDFSLPEEKGVGGFTRCIKDISYSPTDSIVDKGENFSYSLLNLKRESSVYLEAEGDVLTLESGIDRFVSDNKYNGANSKNLDANKTCDGSFMGDLDCQRCSIHNATSHYGILINDSENQYGRLESATYIPLGVDLTPEEIICGKAERYGIGDSYVGLYSFRRFSHVSDKIGTTDQQQEPNTYGDFSLTIDVFGIFDINLGSIGYKYLFCVGDCSKIPDSCQQLTPEGNRVDYRIDVNLRQFFSGFDGNTGNIVTRCWDGIEAFLGNPIDPIRDTYYPNTANTLIHFWTESRVNLWKRKANICDPYNYDFDKNIPVSKGAEIHYRRRKCLELDPEFSKGTAWNKAWLSRIGIQWGTVSILKRWARTFLKILIIAAIGIAGASVGVIGVIIFAVFIFVLPIQKGICDFLTKLLLIRQCAPKCYDGDSNCYSDASKLLPFEDNYSGYNWDFNTKNLLEQKIGMTDPYNTCICDIGEGNQIVYSAKQNPLSFTDAYKNFLVNNYLHIPADRGKVQTLFNLKNNFYAHTSDMIINIATTDGILDLGNGQALEVVTQGGDLRTNPKELFSDIPEGYAGTRDPNAAINTQYGRFFIDREAKKIFLFGGGLKEISTQGVRNFLKENLDLLLLTQFPDYKLVDEIAGIGYRLGFDHRFDKFLLTKTDFVAKKPELLELIDGKVFQDKVKKTYVKFTDEKYFIDKSFTLSWDVNSKRWISFHTYKPDSYVWDRDHMHSIKDSEFWKHGDTYGSFQEFYGKYFPHSIEFIIRGNNGLHNSFTDMELDIEAEFWDGNNWVKGVEKTFTDGLFYNETQSTGKVLFERKDKVNQLDNGKQKTGITPIEYEKDLVRINKIIDRAEDTTSTLFDGVKDGQKVINEDNIGKEKGTFEGRYMIARLILDRPDDTNLQHITKRVMTSQDTTIR